MVGTAHSNPHPEIGTELVRDWAPEGDPRAVIVLVHGLAEHSGRYQRTGSLLAEAGFHVRAFDLIGAGASGGRRWYIEDWSQFHDQVGRHLDWGRDSGKPVVLMGHSLGGIIGLGYALNAPTPPDLLVLSAPSLVGGAAWQRAIAGPLNRVAPTLRAPNRLKSEFLSRDPKVAEAFFADPLVFTSTTARLGVQLFAQMEELGRRLHDLAIPTLVIHGGDDRIISTSSSEVFGELECVERRVYAGLRHECLNEPEGPEVVADIVEWLDGKI